MIELNLILTPYCSMCYNDKEVVCDLNVSHSYGANYSCADTTVVFLEGLNHHPIWLEKYFMALSTLTSRLKIVLVTCSVMVFLADAWAMAQDSFTSCNSLGGGEVTAMHDDRAAYRQCNGAFFSKEMSAWFCVDCLVRQEQANVGSFVLAQIPGVGSKKLWVLEVYERPKLDPPNMPVKLGVTGSEPGTARILLNLPEGASLTVNEKRMRASAGQREIVAKNLDPRTMYEYRFRVTARLDGREVANERKVIFTAGDVVNADFTIHQQTALAKADGR